MVSNRVKVILAGFILVWTGFMVIVYYHADAVIPSQISVESPNDPERERELKIIADEIRKEFQDEIKLSRLKAMPGNDFKAR